MAIKRGIITGCLLLSACTVGPDFTSPKGLSPASWFNAEPPQAQGSQPVESAPLHPDWWHMLNDPMLDGLVKRLASENLDVRTATARVEESRAQRGTVASSWFPQVNGNASYTREKESDKGILSLLSGGGGATGGGASSGGGATEGLPNAPATPPFNIYQYGFDVSWEIDLWGRVRRGVESADAQTQASEEARRGTMLSAIAEMVSDYVQLRGTQASIKTTQENLAAARDLADLTNERYKHGLATDLDVANARAQAANAESQLPPLQQQSARLMNAIALLLGQPPGSLTAQLATGQPIPPVPPRVPIGLPSELARRRPDIRQAEAQLHAAVAQIGVAKADFFPQVTLLGNGELQALQWNQLNSWAARSYSFGPSISLPIFEGGRLVSTLELREAQEKEAAVQYQKTVLNAFHEVDNALTAYRTEQRRRTALEAAANQNQLALKLATERYRKGLSTFLDVLTAERSLLDTQLQEVQSMQTESVNMVQLYKALGGGWEIDFPPTKGAR